MSEQGKIPKRPAAEFLEAAAPWKPVDYPAHMITAMQALERGEANSQQQRDLLKWIIESAAGYYEISYRPGMNGQRDTDFAEGRRFVGQQVVKLLQLNPSRVRKDNPHADDSREQS